MFTITKEFHFSASHQLNHLPPDHPCSRLHGHNYIVEIELQSKTLGKAGFVLDYGELKPFANLIATRLDHRHLNDILPDNPSAENLAAWLYERANEIYENSMWPTVTAVRVSETPKTWAEYRPSENPWHGLIVAATMTNPEGNIVHQYAQP